MPGRSRAEGKEKGKGVIVRWGLEEANPKARSDEQEPDIRCGTLRTSWHVTTKSSICEKVCFINPAFTRGRFCVLLREICLLSSRVILK